MLARALAAWLNHSKNVLEMLIILAFLTVAYSF